MEINYQHHIRHIRLEILLGHLRNRAAVVLLLHPGELERHIDSRVQEHFHHGLGKVVLAVVAYPLSTYAVQAPSKKLRRGKVTLVNIQ